MIDADPSAAPGEEVLRYRPQQHEHKDLWRLRESNPFMQMAADSLYSLTFGLLSPASLAAFASRKLSYWTEWSPRSTFDNENKDEARAADNDGHGLQMN